MMCANYFPYLSTVFRNYSSTMIDVFKLQEGWSQACWMMDHHPLVHSFRMSLLNETHSFLAIQFEFVSQEMPTTVSSVYSEGLHENEVNAEKM